MLQISHSGSMRHCFSLDSHSLYFVIIRSLQLIAVFLPILSRLRYPV